MADTVVDALGARGLTCVVGAGGKKTTLYGLADRIDRAVVTATVRIPIFDRHVADVVVTDDPVDALADDHEWPLGLVPKRPREDRYAGYEPAQVDRIARAGIADAVLVKADGARTREFKAPGEDEPRLPAGADTVLALASVQAVGQPLSDDIVHRPERVAELTGLDLGDEIRPTDVATVLAHERGGRKGVPDGAGFLPVLNKVDDAAAERTARTIAAALLDRGVARVALVRMIDPEPLVAVVS